MFFCVFVGVWYWLPPAIRHNLSRGAGADAVSGCSPGAIFSDAYNRSRPSLCENYLALIEIGVTLYK